MENKNYNSQRKKLILPEYGRHIQEMVDFLSTIDDKVERTRMAHNVIAVMGNLNTHLRDTLDFRHKLWDHLFIMSEFTLDVDSPYPIPTADSIAYVPQQIKYPKGKIRHKQYGRNVRDVINLIETIDSEEDKLSVAISVAKFMKVKSFEYNQEFPSDEVIINDIKQFSDGKIVLSEDTLDSTKLNYRAANKGASKIASNNKRQMGNAAGQKRRPTNAAAAAAKSHFRKKR